MPVKAPKKVDQYFEWVEKYKPVKNEIGTHGAYDNTMFETFPPEIDHVLAINAVTPEKVWTLIEGDEGQWFAAGFHIVNRIGYFITENPWETGSEEYSNDDEPDALFEIDGNTYLCEVGHDEETDSDFIDVYIIENQQSRYKGEWTEKSDLPDMDDEDEVEEFTNELSEFLKTL